MFWHVITEIAMEKPLQLASEELLRTWLLVFVKFGDVWREGNTYRGSKNEKQAATNVTQFGCEFRTLAQWWEAVAFTAAPAHFHRKKLSRVSGSPAYPSYPGQANRRESFT